MAHFDYPYKKGVNITAWVLQFLVCIVLLAVSALLLSAINGNDSTAAGILTAAAGFQIAITALNIVINIIEIVLIAKKRMPPWLYLTSACIKTTIWGIIWILDLISLSVVSIILTLILFATSLMQLIYGAMLVHRKRKGTLTGGKYVPTANPQSHVEANYSTPQPGYYYPPPNAGTEYKPTSVPTTTPSPPQYGYPAPHANAFGQQPGSYEMDSRVHN
ncbi:hypothetical protein GGR54DRAFT_69903 [Hypoxylon sp. NC1633]|nr:hypothetical protein GGR54DRAFT_69903 [Hypoxylon sp. NC1633]